MHDITNSEYHMKLTLKYFNITIYDKLLKCYTDFYISNYFSIKKLEKLIVTFLRLFKCNNYHLNDFNKFLTTSKKTILYFKYRKDKIFLTLALNVYLKYQKYLEDNHEIDFDDMIIKATENVEQVGYSSSLKYIIIDEYQDTSLIRFNLIKNIIDKTGVKLMVVGDDFQSIYRFTGCDLSLFLDFSSYFNNSCIKKIENTYRNSQQLIIVAGNFVMKNKAQIYKHLKSNKFLIKPIKILYYEDIKADFLKLLLYIKKQSNNKIMVLGRNNNDINNAIGKDLIFTLENKIIYRKKQMELGYYMTVHKSNGLEEENVVIINLTNDKLGFPSQLEDDKILRLVSNQTEKYPFAEERRLFYVALTRTKNVVYLFSPKKNTSIFVKELVRHYYKYIEIININD